MLPRMIQSKPEGHYAVGKNVDGQVLLQIADEHGQVRVCLNNREVRMLIELMEEVIVEQDESYKPSKNPHKGRCQDCGLFPNNCECD